MDDLEQRLREDALTIRADVPPELEARIHAALGRTSRTPPEARERPWPSWLAGSLAGAAAVAAVLTVTAVFVVNPVPAPEPMQVEDAVGYSVPEYVRELQRELPLDVRTAALTAPLEEELQNLRSDLEHAKEIVRQDLDVTF